MSEDGGFVLKFEGRNNGFEHRHRQKKNPIGQVAILSPGNEVSEVSASAVAVVKGKLGRVGLKEPFDVGTERARLGLQSRPFGKCHTEDK